MNLPRTIRGLLLLVVLVLCLRPTATAQVYVRGSLRHDGTVVPPHVRTRPDGNLYNNWSTHPNVNPYTGRVGTRIVPAPAVGYGLPIPEGSMNLPEAALMGPTQAWQDVSGVRAQAEVARMQAAQYYAAQQQYAAEVEAANYEAYRQLVEQTGYEDPVDLKVMPTSQRHLRHLQRAADAKNARRARGMNTNSAATQIAK